MSDHVGWNIAYLFILLIKSYVDGGAEKSECKTEKFIIPFSWKRMNSSQLSREVQNLKTAIETKDKTLHVVL